MCSIIAEKKEYLCKNLYDEEQEQLTIKFTSIQKASSERLLIQNSKA